METVRGKEPRLYKYPLKEPRLYKYPLAVGKENIWYILPIFKRYYKYIVNNNNKQFKIGNTDFTYVDIVNPPANCDMSDFMYDIFKTNNTHVKQFIKLTRKINHENTIKHQHITFNKVLNYIEDRLDNPEMIIIVKLKRTNKHLNNNKYEY